MNELETMVIETAKNTAAAKGIKLDNDHPVKQVIFDKGIFKVYLNPAPEIINIQMTIGG